MPRLVISDTSPLRYLVLIGQADLLPALYDAILLALHLKADLVLMDEREGVEEARRLGLTVTGTLGVLDRAAERGLTELAPALARLRQTNFRVDPALLDRLLASDAKRRRK
jgi:predicted nucleic acid-binding protein